jgi:hypothetical protein
MARQVRLDSRGVGAILKSAGVAAATRAAAEAVADNVRSQNIRVGDKDGGKREYDLPVKVTMRTTDRAHADVTIAHPAGQSVQAKHGALTKGAAQAGLDVKARS